MRTLSLSIVLAARTHRALRWCALVTVAAVCVCAVSPAGYAWPWSEEAPAGTPEWWKKHKKSAVFDPERGYYVEEVQSYFDGDGRPIQGPVSVERVVEASESKSEVGLIPGLDPRVQYDKMKTAVGLGPNEQFARAAYAEGERLFLAKEYKAAAEKYEEAVERGPRSPIEQDAMFMLAESYFFGDRYIKARDAYDALVKEHPNTRYLDTVIAREWEIARYWEQYEDYSPDWVLTPNGYDRTRPWFDTIGHAIKTYDNIRLNDPTGPRADDAIMATANIYFRRGRFNDADYHYSLLREQYARSELQFEAHLLGLQAKLRKYQGADYDGAPLDEAKKLVKQLRVQFAGRLSNEEKDRLRLVEGQLNLEVATRDYRMAQTYESTKYYGAARKYYTQVAQKYPGTPLADQAQARLAAIGGEPDTPTKPLARLVNLFPESSERSRVNRIPELQNRTRLAENPAAPVATPGGQAAASTTR